MMTMEASSPLAALPPPSLSGHWQGNRHALELNAGFLRPCKPAEFNFRDMGMRKSTSDYFSFRPLRGSSPTQSLAVDLSQNFHIDQSPRLPTPRRALFTSALNDSGTHRVITPPVPSSSPGPDGDYMEVSPLPHKLPARPQALVPIALCSPTPEPTPSQDQARTASELRRLESQADRAQLSRMGEEFVDLLGEPFVVQFAKVPCSNRRLSHAQRPGVRKGYSSSNVPLRRPKTSESSKTFWFGATSSMLKAPLESFAESPPSERKLAPSISNPSLIIDSINTSFNGSPIGSLAPRRPPVGRNRSGISRRTMSMQYNDSGRTIRNEKRCCTTGSVSLMPKDEYKLKLPHFRTADDEIDALPRITRETFLELLCGTRGVEVGDFAVIDCRFEYEYNGGHIDCALNFNDKEEMANMLFGEHTIGNKTLIFHCEYSAHRAPLMAKYIRQRDRSINQNEYPHLTYPEIYVLDGGYHGFFASHPDRCFPRSYVEMEAKEHESACELGMAKVKRRGKLSRAQTYAFGQSSSIQESGVSSVPTCLSNGSITIDAMDIDFTSPVELKIEPRIEYHPPAPRRFESY